MSEAGPGLDQILSGHGIDPPSLRADDFNRFYQARKESLLSLIEGAMDKKALRDGTGDPQDYSDDFREDEDSEAA